MMTLAEVAEVLAQHGDLPCVPDVELVESHEDHETDTVVLTVTVQAASPAVMAGFELYTGLRRVQDVATMRAVCERYGLDPVQLVAQMAVPVGLAGKGADR